MIPLPDDQHPSAPFSHETRTVILNTAERLFGESGVEGTSVRDITGAAGVNLGAVNFYFGTKDALILAVFARRLEPLTWNAFGGWTWWSKRPLASKCNWRKCFPRFSSRWRPEAKHPNLEALIAQLVAFAAGGFRAGSLWNSNALQNLPTPNPSNSR